jgi:ABC-2 type transport system ATP-binding protein
MIASGPAILITDLHKQYPDAYAPALDGLSLAIKRGSIFGLLGPNGAGKTTTINILCGLISPDSGKAEILGMDVSSHANDIRRVMGIVPQHIALYPGLTGSENLDYIGQLYGLSKAAVKTRSAILMERLGLTQHANKRVARYSGGMKRRVNIIASLLHEPELIILDEPTAGVDVQSRALILSFLKDYQQEGKTIIYTSHHLEEAEQLCEEVAIIDEGKYIIGGSPHELIATTPHCRRLEDVFLHYTGHVVRD